MGAQRLTSLWLLCFVATAALVAVQLLPLVSLLLQFLLAPYWPTLLLNAGFVLMALDGLVGRRDRRLLIAPLLWFGGYGLVATASHIQLAAIERSAAEANAARIPPQTLTRFPLVILNGPGDDGVPSDLRPADLFRHYAIKQAYFRAHDGGDLQHARLLAGGCPKRPGDTAEAPLYYDMSPRDSTRRGNGTAGPCLALQSAAMPRWAIRVVAGGIDRHAGLVEGITQDLQVHLAGSPSFRVRSVQLAPLPWFPRPVAGCYFKGGLGDKWDDDCHFYFDHASWRSTGRTPLQVVAQTLSLQARADAYD